jgi:serine/threonine protein kinase
VTKGSFFKQSHLEDALTEIAILANMRHPNVISLLDWFETKDEVHLVFEQASGGELFDRLHALGHYTERDAACIAAVLCNALDYIHRKGVLHRDLKTHNVLFMGPEFDSRIVLVDFGISKRLLSPSSFTQTIGVGTPSFTAPEVIEGLKYGSKCDDWSLGILVHHLLCGFGPFDLFMDYQDILAGQAKGPQFDTEEWTVISAEGKDFVRRMLTVKPSKRMSAREALDHPWIKGLVPAAYVEQLRSINDQLLGITKAEATTKRDGTSISASFRSPLSVSQALNQASTNGQSFPDLIPHEDGNGASTSPIGMSAEKQSESTSTPASLGSSLPSFTKAESNVIAGYFASSELPNLSMRRRKEAGGA